jgi:hypothetical protein
MRKEIPKIEQAADWEKAVNFIPKKNQIIIYDGIKENDKYIIPPKIKIGDGITTVSDLPFEPGLTVAYADGEGILIIN